jgi:hypothetical protein
MERWSRQEDGLSGNYMATVRFGGRKFRESPLRTVDTGVFASGGQPDARVTRGRHLILWTRGRESKPPEDDMGQTNLRGLESLDMGDLYDLAEGLASKKVGAIEKCVEFILADTKGHWHGRARAKMCRRLKHCEINQEHCQQLVTCITDRLAAGSFSEQFYDQLRLAMHLDQERTFAVAHKCLTSASKEHVRRFAEWIINHEERTCG